MKPKPLEILVVSHEEGMQIRLALAARAVPVAESNNLITCLMLKEMISPEPNRSGTLPTSKGMKVFPKSSTIRRRAVPRHYYTR
jgi:hypothetical protein